MEIGFELEKKDFYESFRAHRHRLFVVTLLLGVMKLFVVVALVGSLVAFFFLPSDLLIRAYLPLVILAVFWMGVIWVAPWWMARSQFSKQPSIHGPATINVDQLGVHWRWSGRSSEIEWKGIDHVLEGKKHFLFYSSPCNFSVLPKRALTTEQLVELRMHLNKYISNFKSISK
jgi:hypothetical protein